jgi:hypothetical protein
MFIVLKSATRPDSSPRFGLRYDTRLHKMADFIINNSELYSEAYCAHTTTPCWCGRSQLQNGDRWSAILCSQASWRNVAKSLGQYEAKCPEKRFSLGRIFGGALLSPSQCKKHQVSNPNPSEPSIG